MQLDQLVVAIEDHSRRIEVLSRIRAEGGRVVEELAALGLVLVELPVTRDAHEARRRLARHPGVRYVEPNGRGEGGDIRPNDPHFAAQWHLENTGQSGGVVGADIEAVSGWTWTRGSEDVVVAVLDSGLVAGQREFAGRTLPGYDFVNEDALPDDDHGHGTQVTALLAANADNDFGVAGVDHRCRVLPVKVLNRFNAGTSFDLAQGLVFAADAGADVLNMSLINYPADRALVDALTYAREAGCVLIACAGNGGVGDADRSFPGRSPLTVSVGATGARDWRAAYSGTGARLDLVAPGDQVVTLAPGSGGGTRLIAGCSAATPVVSGIAALALALDPELGHEGVKHHLLAGAEDLVGRPGEDLPGRDDAMGHGRANLANTLDTLRDRRAPLTELLLGRDELDRAGHLVGMGLLALARDFVDAKPELELVVLADEGSAADARLTESELELRAEAAPDGDGRVYLVWLRAVDDAGNEGRALASVVVARDETPESLALVREEAARLEARLESGGRIPPGLRELARGVLVSGGSRTGAPERR